MPTALTTINTAKQQAITYQPLALVTITMPNGSVQRYSTHPLNAAEGGAPFEGNNYLARLDQQDMAALQARSETGIDLISSVTIRLHDPDKLLYSTYEMAGGGYRGAVMEVTFAFWNAGTSTFSTDKIKQFVGTCGQAGYDKKRLVLTAVSRSNLLREYIPNTPISPRCPKINPRTADQRAEAATEGSKFYPCGETRDLGTAPPCSHTKETCTQPNRYAGINYAPEAGGRGRAYVSGQWNDYKNFAAPGKYGKYFSEGWGYAWVQCEVMHCEGDGGNSTRGEAVIGYSYVHDILQVLVNGVELPAANDMNGSPYHVRDPLLRYNVINRGDRDGSPNAGLPNGDPYGSLAAILFVVHAQVADPSSAPDVRALVRVGLARVYANTSTYTNEFTTNPAWITLAILMRCGISVSEVDLASFLTVAPICDQYINHVDLNGSTVSHQRFRASVWYDRRTPVQEALRRLLNSFGGILQQDAVTGLIRLVIEGPLAEQQPTTQNGSNYNVPLTSTLRTGALSTGYVAYRFTAEDIVADRDGELHVKMPLRGINAQPNRIQFDLIDEDNRYAKSFLTLVDSDDVARMDNKEQTESLPIDGVMSLDQAKRIGRTHLDKLSRGNVGNTTAGTVRLELETTFRAIRIRAGAIVMVHLPEYGIEDQLFRVTGIRPETNFETTWLTLEWHDDAYYVDTNGQSGDPRYERRERDRLPRPSFAWAAANIAPIAGDSMYSQTEKFFSIQPEYDLAADNTALAKVKVTGAVPVNDFSTLMSPLVNRQGTTSSTGGTIPGGGRPYYVAICAKDTSGKLSAPSLVSQCLVTAPGNTNTITVQVPAWDPSADHDGWVAYVGQNPNLLTQVASGTGKPTSITLTSYKERDYGVPDVEADKIVVPVRVVEHSGVLANLIASVSENTFSIPGAGEGPDGVINFVGYDCSILAIPGSDEIPVANFRITANTADSFTVTPDPVEAGIEAGSLLVIRSKPTVSNGGKTFTDPAWRNNTSNAEGMEPTDEVGRYVYIISGPGRGQSRAIVSATATSVTVGREWDGTAPDSTSRYVITQASDLPGEAPSVNIRNASESATVSISVPISNYLNKVLLVKPYTLDGGGNPSLPGLGQEREIYITGDSGSFSSTDVQIAYA